MMRRLLPLVVVALSLSGSAFAQSPSERAPCTFAIDGALDLVVSSTGVPATADSSSPLSTSQPFWISGWALERLSGLQPQSQRVGQFYVWFTRTRGVFGEVEFGTVSMPIVVVRQDVAPAYQGICPAVGPNVGYWAMVTPPSEGGLWTLNLSVMTTDGAGKVVWMPTQKRDMFIWP